nr:hypothetical protein CcurKRNrm1_p160 [Cryptomonas curvata]
MVINLKENLLALDANFQKRSLYGLLKFKNKEKKSKKENKNITGFFKKIFFYKKKLFKKIKKQDKNKNNLNKIKIYKVWKKILKKKRKLIYKIKNKNLYELEKSNHKLNEIKLVDGLNFSNYIKNFLEYFEIK